MNSISEFTNIQNSEILESIEKLRKRESFLKRKDKFDINIDCGKLIKKANK